MLKSFLIHHHGHIIIIVIIIIIIIIIRIIINLLYTNHKSIMTNNNVSNALSIPIKTLANESDKINDDYYYNCFNSFMSIMFSYHRYPYFPFAFLLCYSLCSFLSILPFQRQDKMWCTVPLGAVVVPECETGQICTYKNIMVLIFLFLVLLSTVT